MPTDACMGPQFYHGTPAELKPGDTIEPNKYPQSHPESGDPNDPTPREHTYLSSRKNYVTEYYGPNVYKVEPTGPISHDPEYNNKKMMRSKHPLKVVNQVSRNWGESV